MFDMNEKREGSQIVWKKIRKVDLDQVRHLYFSRFKRAGYCWSQSNFKKKPKICIPRIIYTPITCDYKRHQKHLNHKTGFPKPDLDGFFWQDWQRCSAQTEKGWQMNVDALNKTLWEITGDTISIWETMCSTLKHILTSFWQRPGKWAVCTISVAKLSQQKGNLLYLLS